MLDPAGPSANPSQYWLLIVPQTSILSDWEGPQNTGKYAAGLHKIIVHSAAQATEILKQVQNIWKTHI